MILTAPTWPNKPWFPDLTELMVAWPIPRQEGSAISGEWFGAATKPTALEPSCLAASGISEELSALHSRVLDTLSEVRAPSYKPFECSEMGSVYGMVE